MFHHNHYLMKYMLKAVNITSCRLEKIVSYFYRLRRLCKNYDLLHVHGNSSTSVLELMAANWAGVKRRIVHNHTSRSQHPWINLLLHPFFLMSYTKAIACSDAAGEWLFGNKQYQILRNAIKVSCFHYDVSVRQQIRQLLGISDSTFLVGHVGKFMDAKNHPLLLLYLQKYIGLYLIVNYY